MRFSVPFFAWGIRCNFPCKFAYISQICCCLFAFALIQTIPEHITFDIFGKAGAQIVQTGSQMKRENPNFSYEDYYKDGAVRQIIFSTTERVFNKAMDVNNWLQDEHIEFIGPKTIDKYLQKFTKESFKREIEKHIISKL